MTRRTKIGWLAAVATLMVARHAAADYTSHSELQPGTRCPADPDPSTSHNEGCQPLLWDIPASFPGEAAEPVDGLAMGSAYYDSTMDRPPPLYYVLDANGAIVHDADGRPLGTDIQQRPDPSVGHVCGDATQVSYWDDSVPGVTPTVKCDRGNRVHFGPWSHHDPAWHERTYSAVLRWNNEPTLDAEAPPQRREWWTYYEVYQHEGSHHANMWDATSPCNSPDDAAYAAGGDCKYFRDYYENSSCKENNPSPSCPAYGQVKTSANTWRAATQFPGRFAAPFPTTQPTAEKPNGVQTAIPVLRGQLWPIEHHLVNKWPDQKGAKHPLTSAARYGAVGEIILQFLTRTDADDPVASDAIRRLHVMFEAVIGDADIFVPPHTVVPAGSAWYAPFDLYMGLLTTHSHKRTMWTDADKAPLNPDNLGENRPNCGGGGDLHLFRNPAWDDANTCLYYLEPSGPIAMKRGEALHYRCWFNNGLPLKDAINVVRGIDPETATDMDQAVARTGYRQEYPVKKSCAPEHFPVYPAFASFPGRQCETDDECAGALTTPTSTITSGRSRRPAACRRRSSTAAARTTRCASSSACTGVTTPIHCGTRR